MFDFIKNISGPEIIIIVLILVVLFGAKIITGLARTSGEAVKELKEAKKEFADALKDDGKGVSKK